HTSTANITQWPDVRASASDVDEKLEEEKNKFNAIWDRLSDRFHCPIIQNNFEMPLTRLLGNRDSSHTGGHLYFISRLNLEWAQAAQKRSNLFINDIHFL